VGQTFTRSSMVSLTQKDLEGRAPAGDAVSPAAVQRHRRSQDRAGNRHAGAWPASIATSTGHTSAATHLVGDISAPQKPPTPHRQRRACGVSTSTRLFGSQTSAAEHRRLHRVRASAPPTSTADHSHRRRQGASNPLEARPARSTSWRSSRSCSIFPPAPGLGWDGKLDPEEVCGGFSGDAGPNHCSSARRSCAHVPHRPVLHLTT